MTVASNELREKLDALTFRRLLSHLDNNKNVQNIELMIVANFCRNCLADWYKEAANEVGVQVDKEEARKRIYGMPYNQWKKTYQSDATPEQMAVFESRREKNN